MQIKAEIVFNTYIVEEVTFTLAIFLTTRGMSKNCKRFVNKLADLMARKKNERNCNMIRHVRFAMLRTTLIGLRSYRSKKIENKYETLGLLSLKPL